MLSSVVDSVCVFCLLGAVLLGLWYLKEAMWMAKQARVRVGPNWHVQISQNMYMPSQSIPHHLKKAGRKFKVVEVDAFQWDVLASPAVIDAVNLYMKNGGYGELYMYQFINKVCPPDDKSIWLPKLW